MGSGQQQQQQNQQKPFNSILGSGQNNSTATTPMNQQQQTPHAGGVFSTASNLFSGATNAATGGLFSNRQQPPKGVPQIVPTMGVGQQQQQQQPYNQQQVSYTITPISDRSFHPKLVCKIWSKRSYPWPRLATPEPVLNLSPRICSNSQQQQQQGFGPGGVGMQGQQPGGPGGPNLMQKLTEITAPGGDMLSKGKELIFMKFGLGGK